MQTIPGIDGKAPYGFLPPDGCCPPPLCQLDLCSLICNFVQHLPNGPMWDRPKRETVEWYRRQSGQDPCLPAVCDERCPTMVDHAVYWALLLGDGLMGPLATLLREANPYTAATTLDAWLERLGWRDCYDCACRDAGGAMPSPYEIWGATPEGFYGPVCAKPTFPPELQLAVKRGTVVALHRLKIGPRRNIDALNFVIAPLGAMLEPKCYRDVELDPTECHNDDGTTLCLPPAAEYTCDETPDPYRCPADDCPGHDTMGAQCAPIMRQWTLCLKKTGDVIPRVIPGNCATAPPASLKPGRDDLATAPHDPAQWVQAYYEPGPGDAEGLPARIWPGLMAAECIVRAALPRGRRVTLELCL